MVVVEALFAAHDGDVQGDIGAAGFARPSSRHSEYTAGPNEPSGRAWWEQGYHYLLYAAVDSFH